MKASKKSARLAGVYYLLLLVFVIIAEIVRNVVIVPGDAAATAENIMASEWLFRFGFVSDLMHMTAFVMVAFTLYALLKTVNPNLALLFVLFTLAAVVIMSLNMLNLFAPLLLLNGEPYLNVYESGQLHAQVMLFLDLHANGFLIAQIFFGLWLLPLGILVYKSGYFPKMLGALLMAGCFGYLIDFFQNFLFPAHHVISYPGLAIATIAEVSFLLWLLIKGADIKQREHVTSA